MNPGALAEIKTLYMNMNVVTCQSLFEPPKHQQTLTCVICAGEEKEELHGKLEDDRFLFSLENESAACDVLDLREVLSVFLKDG